MNPIRRITILALLVSLVCCNTKIFAQTLSTERSSQSTHDSNSTRSPDVNRDLEADWVEMSGQFNDRIITTVYWSLGGVVGVVILLAGYSSFLNLRFYDRDKKELSSQMAIDVKQQVESLRLELKELYQQQSKATSESAAAVVATITTPLEDKLKRLETTTASIRETVQRNSLETQLQLELIEVRYWEMKNVDGNVITCLVSAGKIALNLDIDWRVHDILKKIGAIASRNPNIVDDSDTLGFLQALPIKYEVMKSRILRKVKDS